MKQLRLGFLASVILTGLVHAQSTSVNVNSATQSQQGGMGNTQEVDLGNVKGKGKTSVNAQRISN